MSNVTLIKNRNLAYQSLKFYLSKHKDYIEDGKFFLNQIILLLKEFEILTTEVKLDRTYFRRRDKSNMQQLYIVIYSNYLNLYNLIRNIGFMHNSKRRKASLNALVKIKPKVREELRKMEQYEKALRLRKEEGLSAYKVAKKLKVKVYHVKSWLYFNKKPLLYNFIKKLNNS